MTRYRTTPCRGCGRHVIWVQARCPKCADLAGPGGCAHCHERGVVRVPLDAAAPVFVIRTDPDGENEFEQQPFAELPAKDARRAFVSHFATCVNRDQFSSSKRRETH